jgi:hypothetical protein
MNTLLTPQYIAREVMRELYNNLKFAGNINRDYDDQFAQEGAKIGSTAKARLPQRYVVQKGAALVTTPVEDRTVDISITDQAHVGIEFSSREMKLDVDDYKKRYIQPAVEALVNQIDYDGISRMYKKVANTVGVPGTVPTANETYLDAGVKLQNEGNEMDRMKAILSPAMHAKIANANLALFNPAAAISSMFRKGQFGQDALGIPEWYSSTHVPMHTVGALGGTPLVNGANQTGSSLITNGWTNNAAILKAGDVIQIANVNQVNPHTRENQGLLRDFVVTADTVADGSGNATLPISPAIVTSGPYQNVDAGPAHAAAITIFGHASSHANKKTRQGLVFDPDFATMVFVDLELPQGVWAASRARSKKLGLSVRFVKAFDIRSDTSPARLDVMYGFSCLRPEMAARVCS